MPTTYGLLSTHPPTQCGLATFNAALAARLGEFGRPGVVRVTAGLDEDGAGPDVVHTWPARSVGGWQAAAAALDRFDIAVIQHEYGIYPGPDGADVLPLLQRLTVPTIVVLHTVLAQPTAAQRTLLEQIVTAADAVVTMTGTARHRLVHGYRIDARKVTVIPHGATEHTPAATGSHPRPHLLTWGLLGPGKGIEWMLRALARLRSLDPPPFYTVAGRTHPRVLEQNGEAYRAGLLRLGAMLDVTAAVHYDPVYRDDAELGRLIGSADVVVLPYESREQVTSGVLTEAVAAGIPVVATPFPHAVELLTDGPGLLVPYEDAAALAAAIRRILTEPGLAASLVGRTRNQVTTLRWPAVAARYDMLARQLLAARSPVAVPA